MEKKQAITYQLNLSEKSSKYKGFTLLLEAENGSNNMELNAIDGKNVLKVHGTNIESMVGEMIKEIDMVKSDT